MLQSVKIAFYLDPLDRDTGCLKVIPGSHRRPFSKYLQVMNNQHNKPHFGVSGSEIPGVALECHPGDVIIFTESVFHAAFGGGVRSAPAYHKLFAATVTEEQEAWLRRIYEGWKYALHPAETFANSNRPRIRRLASRMVDMGFDTLKV